MPLPNPGMSFTPFDPLPASDLNELVENIEALADGTGLDLGAVTSTKLAEAFLRGRYQANTTNSAPTGLTMQMGWGFIEGDGTATVIETVTFPTAFSAAPLIISSLIGVDTSVIPDSLDDFSTSSTTLHSLTTYAPTTTNFIARIYRASGTLAAGNWYGYSWLAIGTV